MSNVEEPVVYNGRNDLEVSDVFSNIDQKVEFSQNTSDHSVTGSIYRMQEGVVFNKFQLNIGDYIFYNAEHDAVCVMPSLLYSIDSTPSVEDIVSIR